MGRTLLMSGLKKINCIALMVLILMSAKVVKAQNLEFVDLGVIEGEFKRYNRTLTWKNPGNDSIKIHLWTSSDKLNFGRVKSHVAGRGELEIPISIDLSETTGDMEYELRLLDNNDLVLHGFQMKFKVLQGELDVFKAYRNVHFPFRTKEEVFNLKSAKRGDTLTAYFDVYNLGGKDLKASTLVSKAGVSLSFTSKELVHNSFSRMRVDFVSNEETPLGFQKQAVKFYAGDKLMTVLPLQYTILPNNANMGSAPRLTTNIVNHDFKVTKVGESKDVSIVMANNGNAPLVIERIESNCDCLSYNQVDAIEPGKSTTLNVTFDATDRKGLERKTLAIFSNDPKRSVLVLTFRAHVK